MDVLQYFHLNEQPFRIGPDPRFLYLSDQVKEAIAKCEYMARERIGPIYWSLPRHLNHEARLLDATEDDVFLVPQALFGFA
jgi:hypothetical protein